MIICVCRSVSDRDIAREAAAGCPDFASLQKTLGVSTCCGVCREFAEDAFDDAQAQCATACGRSCQRQPAPATFAAA